MPGITTSVSIRSTGPSNAASAASASSPLPASITVYPADDSTRFVSARNAGSSSTRRTVSLPL
jgi:hypothetical protein